ncbi:hypothetical protein K501DRAFT_200518 [Backusella circina FSU 941]|nr:hypothetical protein K501DRAFT_200518 [Backusella circina FSU 941]
MVSKQVLHILGLQLHVFGLEEYKQLPEGTSLCAMFFMTGIKTPQEYVERSCREMCELNKKRHPNDRYLIMVSLDHPNVGSRELYRDDVMQVTKTLNADLLAKMYLHAKSSAHSISLITECFDLCVFGENSKSFVEKWGAIGFSMGGVAAALSISYSRCLHKKKKKTTNFPHIY